MKRIIETYRRLGAHSYEYEAPELKFAADLECDDECVVQLYRGLWKAWP